MTERIIVIDKVDGNIQPEINSAEEETAQVLGEFVSSLSVAFQIAERPWDEDLNEAEL